MKNSITLFILIFLTSCVDSSSDSSYANDADFTGTYDTEFITTGADISGCTPAEDYIKSVDVTHSGASVIIDLFENSSPIEGSVTNDGVFAVNEDIVQNDLTYSITIAGDFSDTGWAGVYIAIYSDDGNYCLWSWTFTGTKI